MSPKPSNPDDLSAPDRAPAAGSADPLLAILYDHLRAVAQQRMNAEQRNRFACAISAAVLILHASPNGKLERLAAELLASGKRVWTLDDPANAELVRKGAKPMNFAQVGGAIRTLCFGKRVP